MAFFGFIFGLFSLVESLGGGFVGLVLNYLLSRKQSRHRGKVALIYCFLGRRCFFVVFFVVCFVF